METVEPHHHYAAIHRTLADPATASHAAHLEHHRSADQPTSLNISKPDDFYMHDDSHAAGEHAIHADPGGSGSPEGSPRMMANGGGGHPHGENKPLTSRYRGVCWNKKNRRWQAAINSSGKYIYLGSFVSEEDAAKAFDRAAIRLRGNRAKLNFNYHDYLDEQGNFVEDARLTSILTKVENTKPGKGTPSSGLSGHENALPGADIAALAGMDTAAMLYNARLAAAAAANGAVPKLSNGIPGHDVYAAGQDWTLNNRAVQPKLTMTDADSNDPNRFNYPHLQRQPAAAPGAKPYSVYPGIQASQQVLKPNLAGKGLLGGLGGFPGLDARMPPGCTLEHVIPGEDDVFGAVYHNAQQATGSAVWDGNMLQDLGLYDTAKDAATACTAALRLVLLYKHQLTALAARANPLQNAADGATPSADALSLLNSMNASKVPLPPGLLLSGSRPADAAAGLATTHMDGEGLPQAAGNGLPVVLPHLPNGKSSYSELFQWLNTYQRPAAADAVAGRDQAAGGMAPDAAAAAGAAADRRDAGEDTGGSGSDGIASVKRLSDEMAGGTGSEADDFSAKKARVGVSDIAQVGKLSTVKLQDALKSLLESSTSHSAEQ